MPGFPYHSYSLQDKYTTRRGRERERGGGGSSPGRDKEGGVWNKHRRGGQRHGAEQEEVHQLPLPHVGHPVCWDAGSHARGPPAPAQAQPFGNLAEETPRRRKDTIFTRCELPSQHQKSSGTVRHKRTNPLLPLNQNPPRRQLSKLTCEGAAAVDRGVAAMAAISGRVLPLRHPSKREKVERVGCGELLLLLPLHRVYVVGDGVWRGAWWAVGERGLGGG